MAKKKAKAEGSKIVGTLVTRPLAEVTKNKWNPNKMDEFTMDALRQGLISDGWLASQALLVWGSDETGTRKNIIIDGEHRWRVATEIGFKEGPMVFLEGLKESAAKALTIKMNQKRGQFDEVSLGALLREIQYDLGSENMFLDFGIQEERLMSLLAEPELPKSVHVEFEAKAGGDEEITKQTAVPAPPSPIKMVQLFLDKVTYDAFQELVKNLGPRYSMENASDVVMEALRRENARSA